MIHTIHALPNVPLASDPAGPSAHRTIVSPSQAISSPTLTSAVVV